VFNPKNPANFTMKPKRTNHDQGLLFESRLSRLLDPKHELVIFSKLIDWESLEKDLSIYFCESTGAPAKPVRLITGLLLLQHLYNLSDEKVVYGWRENPYWQLFCGYDYLQWSFPIDPSSLSNWRQRLGETGLNRIFSSTVSCALDVGLVSSKSFETVIADTTVMPKNISYPTDARLYFNSINKLIRFAKKFNISLRQTYKFLAKKAFRNVGRYTHCRKMKMASRERRRLKTYLGRIRRELERELQGSPKIFELVKPTLEIVDRILVQERESKNKVYSLHEPFVECISKGKAHKKYEFGCKASIVLTHKECFALSVRAFHGNPYDGHTLKEVLDDSEKLTGITIKRAFADKGYKGHQAGTNRNIFLSGMRGLSMHFKRLLRRRSAIEPCIGHMKSDGKLDRNYLKGTLGDCLNAILCGIGHNARMLLRFLRENLDPSTVFA
jgi:IS5 family transposase